MSTLAKGDATARGTLATACRSYINSAFPGDDHRDAVLVGGGDDLGIAHGAAGLDDGAHAGPGRRVHAVAEGEEGVGRQRRLREVEAVVARLHHRDAGRVDAAHLPRPDAE